MIEFTSGDMFEVEADVRVNTVNCVGVMGAGVALVFKQRYPSMFTEYQDLCRRRALRPGKLHVWSSLIGETVVNFPTKDHWREPSEYEYIASGLLALRDYLRPMGSVKVALPALGCGHGGLEWSKVSQMILLALADLPAHIYVFTPGDSVKLGSVEPSSTSAKELSDLAELGFHPCKLYPPGRNTNEMSAFCFGDESIRNLSWVQVIPPLSPQAITPTSTSEIALKLGSMASKGVAVLVHSGSSSLDVAEAITKEQIPVIVVLPFGIFSRMNLVKQYRDRLSGSFVLVSFVAPSTSSGRRAFFESTRHVQQMALSKISLAETSTAAR